MWVEEKKHSIAANSLDLTKLPFHFIFTVTLNSLSTVLLPIDNSLLEWRSYPSALKSPFPSSAWSSFSTSQWLNLQFFSTCIHKCLIPRTLWYLFQELQVHICQEIHCILDTASTSSLEKLPEDLIFKSINLMGKRDKDIQDTCCEFITQSVIKILLNILQIWKPILDENQSFICY